jgi:hypothetical protein
MCDPKGVCTIKQGKRTLRILASQRPTRLGQKLGLFTFYGSTRKPYKKTSHCNVPSAAQGQ